MTHARRPSRRLFGKTLYGPVEADRACLYEHVSTALETVCEIRALPPNLSNQVIQHFFSGPTEKVRMLAYESAAGAPAWRFKKAEYVLLHLIELRRSGFTDVHLVPLHDPLRFVCKYCSSRLCCSSRKGTSRRVSPAPAASAIRSLSRN